MGLNYHQINTTLALALALGTIAPAQASARLELNPRQATSTPSHEPAVQIVRVSSPGGFDWGDASIGAAGALGLSMAAIGGGLVIAARRTRAPARDESRPRRNALEQAAGDLSRCPEPKPNHPLDQQEAVK
jgi:hypothetical protein